MIRVKNIHIFTTILSYSMDTQLYQLIHTILKEGIMKEDNIIITSAYRPNDKGVHGTIPYRGIDLRSWHLEDPQAICDKINARITYDPTRPEKVCAIYHEVKAQGKHIHLQVHENTIWLD